jgi:hypothetical protein
MSDIFDTARQGLAAEQARRQAARESEERLREAEQRQREEGLRQARHRLRELNAQIRELHTLLKQSGVPPSNMAGSRLSRIRGALARPEGASRATQTGGQAGWSLAEVPLTARRIRAVGSDPKSGTQYGLRDVAIGGQGIVLLTDGELREYRRFGSGTVIEIGDCYDRGSDFPPAFVMPQQPGSPKSGNQLDAQAAAINDWSARLEETMIRLAKDAYRRRPDQ